MSDSPGLASDHDHDDHCAVINQMDTSQAHLSSKGGASKDPSKPDALSKDELHAVLKYGAQKMCVIRACPCLVAPTNPSLPPASTKMTPNRARNLTKWTSMIS